MEKLVKILNETGLHARPASQLVQTAVKFSSDVNIEFGGTTSNAKSIMSIMGLGLKKDDEIKIIANGSDQEAAMDAVISLIETKFGEA